MSNSIFGSAGSGRPSQRSEATEEARRAASQEETIRFNAEIPKSLHKQIRLRAAEEGISQKDLFVRAIRSELNNSYE